MIKQKDIQNAIKGEQNRKKALNKLNDDTLECKYKQDLMEARFEFIEQHVTLMARERCIQDSLRNELKMKDDCVTELVSILEDQESNSSNPNELNPRIDEIQLNITLIESRCKAYEEELQALS